MLTDSLSWEGLDEPRTKTLVTSLPLGVFGLYTWGLGASLERLRRHSLLEFYEYPLVQADEGPRRVVSREGLVVEALHESRGKEPSR